MLLCALTGGIGCGKSTAVKFFRSHSIPVVDADEVARQVVEPGKPAYLQLRQEFGAEFFDDQNGGILLREKLGELVFKNVERRRKLNSITHPAIHREILSQVIKAFLRGEKILILDIPLLFESGAYGFIQKIIVVHCTPEKQLDRLAQRDQSLNREQAQNRINSQLSNEYKIQRAHFIIDNNGSIEETHQQLQHVVDELKKSWIPFIFRTILFSSISALALLLIYLFV